MILVAFLLSLIMEAEEIGRFVHYKNRHSVEAFDFLNKQMTLTGHATR